MSVTWTGKPARLDVRVGTPTHQSKVLIDGIDISHAVAKVTVEADVAEGIPVVVLRLVGDIDLSNASDHEPEDR